MMEKSGNGTNGRARVAPRTEDVGTDYPGAFPNSKKVFVEGSRGVRVPMREIHLTGGEAPLRVYDTSSARFLSPDPVLHDLNQFGYTLGNPLDFLDADGAAAVAQGDTSAAATGAASCMLRHPVAVSAPARPPGNPYAMRQPVMHSMASSVRSHR